MSETSGIASKVQEIYSLEQLSGGTGIVHDRHPAVKLISTLIYVVLVVSFDRTQLTRLVPFIFYPVILMALSGTPWVIVLKRFMLALPFCLFAGITSIFFDRTAAFALGGVTVSLGVISFFSIILRSFLCVCAVLLLVAVTPFSALAKQLRRFHVPDIFVTLFEMIYRYVGSLLDEASTMHTAYMLRSARHAGLQIRHMGSFVGQLLIRSYDRAERVYSAMKCRGYAERGFLVHRRPLEVCDYVYLLATTLPFIALRIFRIY